MYVYLYINMYRIDISLKIHDNQTNSSHWATQLQKISINIYNLIQG